VLLPLYPDPETRSRVIENPQTAPIPDVHKAMFRFTERFVRASGEMRPEDLDALRAVGLSERDIVTWATLGSTQSWFTTSADGGGIPLEDDAITGPGVGRTREVYEATTEGLFAPHPQAPRSAPRPTSGVAWVETNETDSRYLEAARTATERYGFVPNLLRAVSLQPAYYRRHLLAMELLERPQSSSLPERCHALVRARVSQLTGSAYGETTSRALLARHGGEEAEWRALESADGIGWTAQERVVLDFAAKVARNAYKVTAKDAQSFRDQGLDDEAYIDVLNTVSIQVALDRLANCLGVVPDDQPILPK
jgi:uncharacterized peroxidase-related enzyme